VSSCGCMPACRPPYCPGAQPDDKRCRAGQVPATASISPESVRPGRDSFRSARFRSPIWVRFCLVSPLTPPVLFFSLPSLMRGSPSCDGRRTRLEIKDGIGVRPGLHRTHHPPRRISVPADWNVYVYGSGDVVSLRFVEPLDREAVACIVQVKTGAAALPEM
jgi:hypothetical protein